MDEYISKKQAVDLLETLPNPYNLLSLHTIGMAIDFIKNQPAADVQPIRHGRWIDHEKFERKNCNVCIECSVCNTGFGHDCIPKTKFCPNCGARMDGEQNDR